MSLTLCIETSALPYGVVLGEGTDIIFNSVEQDDLQQLKDVAALTTIALERTKRSAKEIKAIVVNQGPGGTSAIRGGVAFANSLAYSLGISVFPLNTFELIGFEIAQVYSCPVVITVKSIKGNAYVGWYDNGVLQQTCYGLMEDMVKQVSDQHQEFAVAGAHREAVVSLFPDKTIHDSGKKFGQAASMLQMPHFWSDRGLQFPRFIYPLTEQSAIFE